MKKIDITSRLRKQLTKRQKLVLATLFLTGGLIATQLVSGVRANYQAVIIYGAAAFLTSFWVLKEDLKGMEWLFLLCLPTLYSFFAALFYFLVPVRWLTRLSAALIYGLGIYALLLTENIFNIASLRTIRLLRAAQSVGFLLTLITGLMSFVTIFSFHLHFWLNFLFIFLFGFILCFQSLWSVKLEKGISREIWELSLTTGFCLGELALVLSFWPVTPAVAGLVLTVGLYEFLGIGQLYLDERLFMKNFKEFIFVGIITLILLIKMGQWGG